MWDLPTRQVGTAHGQVGDVGMANRKLATSGAAMSGALGEGNLTVP